MSIESKEIFIPGPSGRIQAKYYKSKQEGAMTLDSSRLGVGFLFEANI